MPAALLIGALGALAFALVGIAISDTLRTYVVGSIYAAAHDASTVPVIGGALSWVVWNIGHWIDATIGNLSWIAVKSAQDAVAYWNWLIQQSVSWIFSAQWSLLYQTWNLANATYGTVTWIVNARLPMIDESVSQLQDQTLWILTKGFGDVWNAIAGHSAAIGNLQQRADWAQGQIAQVVTQAIPNIWTNILDHLTRIQVLERWADETATQTLPRLETDVARRALEAEAEALRQRVTQLEKSVGILMALGILAIAGADAINNLRCQMDLQCADLSNLVDGNLEARVSDLELGEI